MEYFSLKEVCKELAVSEATLKNWIKLNKISPINFANNTKNFVGEAVDNKIRFSKEYIIDFKKNLQSGKIDYLKSRRNKKFISGNNLYKGYLSDESKNISVISELLIKIDELKLELNKSIINILIAECSSRLMKNIPLKTLIESCQEGAEKLVFDLVDDKQKALDFINKYPELFDFDYVFEPNEDVLGLLYMSLSNMGERKSRGAYFTPNKVVEKLVSSINIKEGSSLIDPCCGTGNFLLRLPDNVKLDQIFGNDIDETSVEIVRINLFLKYRPNNIDILYSNITNKDFLNVFKGEFDYIIGNPPWGCEFSKTEKQRLKEKYNSIKGKNIESYDLFIEKSLSCLNRNGVLAFVLPEAILNVKSHEPIRKIILKGCELRFLEFLGNAFDKVNCPSIILQLEKTPQKMSLKGAQIKTKNEGFVISKEREVNPEQFEFGVNDKEYEILQKLYNADNRIYLKDNADFALGIVTGNNAQLLSDKKTSDNEVVIKGSDIDKYKITEGDNYIKFEPERFQQVASESFYRAKEKLFYKFISKKLVFAYDDKQRLSLNSCNILIPKLCGESKNKESIIYNIKYIMAILNSRIAQFVFEKRFNSIKVLRSHIEDIPIPACRDEEQKVVTGMVDELLKNPDNKELYDRLDTYIAELYGLTDDEYNVLTSC